MRVRVHAHIAQQPSEYGSACLAMLAEYYGKHSTLLRCARLCGVTPGGCVMEQISIGAKELGFTTQIREISIGDIKKEKRPCIVAVDDKFAVIEHFRGDKIFLVTPYAGRIQMKASEFEKSYKGKALFLFPPLQKFPITKHDISVFKFIISLVLGQNPLFIVIYMALMAVIAYIFSVLPHAVAIATDLVYKTNLDEMGFIWRIVGDTVIFLAALFFFEMLMIPAFRLFSVNVTTFCRKRFVWASFNLPIDSYQIRSEGYYLKAADDVKDLGYFLSKQIVEAIIRPILAIFFLWEIFYISIPVFVVVLITIIFLLLVTTISAYHDNEKGRKFFADQCIENSFVIEGVKAIRSIKNSGAEFSFFRKYVELNRHSALSEKPYLSSQRLFDNMPVFISNLTKLLIILIGVQGIYSGANSFGDLLLIHGLYCIIQEYLKEAILAGKVILSAFYQIENMYEICSEGEKNLSENSPEIKIDYNADYNKLKGHVVLDHVTFGYSQYSGEILKDISMDIPAGSSVAIVGPSGCGKTTLKKLICGRLEPWSGEILFDGVGKKDLPDVVFNNSLSAVDQKIIMFEDNVMNNIKMWDDTQLDADAILAARDANIHSEIIMRNKKYKAPVSDNAENFSGGERQRLEIARALSMDPSIIVLDEATSALDTIIEKRIVDNIKSRGITTIVIAHRLSTIRNCDMIYVMDNGRVADKGTHEQLMNSCDIYRKLVTVE